MRRALILGLLALAAIIGVVGALLLYRSWYVIGEHTAEVEFQVVAAPVMGFNAGTDKVYFGKVAPGGGASRELLLSSEVEGVATVLPDSGLRGWVVSDPARARVPAGELVKVRLNLNVPSDAEPGNYTGSVTVRYTRR